MFISAIVDQLSLLTIDKSSSFSERCDEIRRLSSVICSNRLPPDLSIVTLKRVHALAMERTFLNDEIFSEDIPVVLCGLRLLNALHRVASGESTWEFLTHTVLRGPINDNHLMLLAVAIQYMGCRAAIWDDRELIYSRVVDGLSHDMWEDVPYWLV